MAAARAAAPSFLSLFSTWFKPAGELHNCRTRLSSHSMHCVAPGGSRTLAFFGPSAKQQGLPGRPLQKLCAASCLCNPSRYIAGILLSARASTSGAKDFNRRSTQALVERPSKALYKSSASQNKQVSLPLRFLACAPDGLPKMHSASARPLQ